MKLRFELKIYQDSKKVELFYNKATSLTLQQCFSTAHLSIASVDIHGSRTSSSTYQKPFKLAICRNAKHTLTQKA